MALRLIVPVALLVMLGGACGGGGATSVSPCAGDQLSGTFAVVPGSAGAGNIVYALRLRNRSGRSCSVAGVPLARLLGGGGRPLPMHVVAASRGGSGHPVTLAAGQSTEATARFSPDVPGPGEPAGGRPAPGHPVQCEPTASSLRVSGPGGGTTTVPVDPPTPVCEHGQLQFSTYGRA